MRLFSERKLNCRPASGTVVLLALGIAWGRASNAAPLTAADILAQFNAVVSDSVSTTADVEGRLVAGTLTRTGALFNNPRIVAASKFAAVNAITVGPNVYSPVDNGGSVNVQGTNAGTFSFLGGGGLTTMPAFTIGDFTAPLDALTAELATLTPNSAVDTADPNDFAFNIAPDASGTAFLRFRRRNSRPRTS